MAMITDSVSHTESVITDYRCPCEHQPMRGKISCPIIGRRVCQSGIRVMDRKLAVNHLTAGAAYIQVIIFFSTLSTPF